MAKNAIKTTKKISKAAAKIASKKPVKKAGYKKSK